jgi:hypothetical protein
MTIESLSNQELRTYNSVGIIKGLDEELQYVLGENNGRETRTVKNLRTARQIEKAFQNHTDIEKKYNLPAMPYFYIFQVGFIRDRRPALFQFNPTNLTWNSNFTDRPKQIVSGSTAKEALDKLLASRHQDK